MRIGARVTFVLPDGIEREGEVARRAGKDWVVSVDCGAYYLLPEDEMALADVRTDISERRDPAEMTNGDYALALSYSAAYGRPRDAEVSAWVNDKYPTWKVTEVSNGQPGRLHVLASRHPGLLGEELAGSGGEFDVSAGPEGLEPESPEPNGLVLQHELEIADLEDRMDAVEDAYDDLSVGAGDLHFPEVGEMPTDEREGALGPSLGGAGSAFDAKDGADPSHFDDEIPMAVRADSLVSLLWKAFGNHPPLDRIRAATELRRRLHGDDEAADLVDKILDMSDEAWARIVGPRTEEDGEVRETLGGPGLDVRGEAIKEAADTDARRFVTTGLQSSMVEGDALSMTREERQAYARLLADKVSRLQGRTGVDDEAKKYHEDYWGDYGTALVAEDVAGDFQKIAPEADAPPGREEQVKELKKEPVDNPYAVAWDSFNQAKAERRRGLIEDAFKAQGRKASAWEKLACLIVLKRVDGVMGRMQRVAQQAGHAVGPLMMAADRDSSLQSALDTMIVRLISRNKSGLRRALGDDVYRSVLAPALQEGAQRGSFMGTGDWGKIKRYLDDPNIQRAMSLEQQRQRQPMQPGQLDLGGVALFDPNKKEWTQGLPGQTGVVVRAEGAWTLVNAGGRYFWMEVSAPTAKEEGQPDPGPGPGPGPSPSQGPGAPSGAPSGSEEPAPAAQPSEPPSTSTEPGEPTGVPGGAKREIRMYLMPGAVVNGQPITEQMEAATTQTRPLKDGTVWALSEGSWYRVDVGKGNVSWGQRPSGWNAEPSEGPTTWGEPPQLPPTPLASEWPSREDFSSQIEEDFATAAQPPAGSEQYQPGDLVTPNQGAALEVNDPKRGWIPMPAEGAGQGVTLRVDRVDPDGTLYLDMYGQSVRVAPGDVTGASDPGRQPGFRSTRPHAWGPTARVEHTGLKELTMDKRSSAMANVFRALKIDKIERRGSYTVLSVVWDADDPAFEHRESAGIRQCINTFVKGQATMKEGALGDLGTIGRVRFTDFDPDAGIAEVAFQSSTMVQAPLSVMTIRKADL